MTRAAPLGPHAAVARAATLAALAALAVALVAWRAGTGAWWTGLAFTLPLVPGLPGLLRGKRYTYAWMTLVTCGYLALGLVETMANPVARWPATAILLLAFALFVALIAFLRGSRP